VLTVTAIIEAMSARPLVHRPAAWRLEGLLQGSVLKKPALESTSAGFSEQSPIAP